MTSNPQAHDFDWVKEHLECSVGYEFAKLEEGARANADTVSKSGPDKGECEVKSKGSKSFSVGCKGERLSIHFVRDGKNYREGGRSQHRVSAALV